jgi:hypothetical protein
VEQLEKFFKSIKLITIMGTERRRSPRFILHQLIEIEFDRETFIPVQGLDLSLHGVACKTQLPLELYSRVYMLIQLNPNDEQSTLEAEGQVLRCDPMEEGLYRIGIEFRNLSASNIQKIKEWSSEREPI